MQWLKDGAPVPSGWDGGAERSMGMCNGRTGPPEHAGPSLTRVPVPEVTPSGHPHAGRGGREPQAGERATCHLRLS